MIRIGLLSDTHASTHERVFDFLKDCDQLWHAGDIGNMDTLMQLASFKPTIAVYGNCDDQAVRHKTRGLVDFKCGGMRVIMTHIGGYPGRYGPEIRQMLLERKPDIFVAGHSHILRVQYDQKMKLMYLNPGAAGRYGLHKSVTCLRFGIRDQQLCDMEVLDIARS